MSLLSVGFLSWECSTLRRRSLKRLSPKDKNRNEVLGARVNLYMAAKKWDMAAAVASHLVKVEPGTGRLVAQSRLFGQADRGRREGGSHSAEGANATSQGCHDRIQPCLLRERHRPHRNGERAPSACDSILIETFANWRIDDEDLKPLWHWIAGFD